jgi:hypothetical protein
MGQTGTHPSGEGGVVAAAADHHRDLTGREMTERTTPASTGSRYDGDQPGARIGGK